MKPWGFNGGPPPKVSPTPPTPHDAMIYFRTYARERGCPVNMMGDRAVWNFILAYQGKEMI